MILGIDTGGTFTDAVSISEDGSISIRKTPSNPRNPANAILSVIRLIAPEFGFQLVHGTTVATNALLQRSGARTALITTRGCRDVLEIGRQTREHLYSTHVPPRVPLVPRDLRFEVTERLDWLGNTVIPLDRESIENALDAIAEAGVEAVAVCLLHSYVVPDHEREIEKRALDRGLFVSISSRIAPEFREYERTSTVCANAFVGPVMANYISQLSERVQECGASGLSVMQSDGGTLRAAEAAAVAVKTVLSGPAGGVIAASRIAGAAGYHRIMTFDMGGTSTDVSLIDGKPSTVRTGEVAGLPILTPMLDIHTVGAGGGSIARIDSGGALKVGPNSAGADPGPVAYGNGTNLTVTDASVLLGRLPGSVRLAGALTLDIERVRLEFERLAHQMGTTPERAAEGVIAVVNANMARALMRISTERGHDPVEYTLVSFGGAGGLHACELAEMLKMSRILVPRYPGAFAALGLAIADARREAVRSLFVPVDQQGGAAVRASARTLARTVRAEMAAEGCARADIALHRFVEIRYVGQSYSLRVTFGSSLECSARAFHRAHKLRYGHFDPLSPVEVIAVGVIASSRRSPAALPRVNVPADPGAPIAWTSVHCHGHPLRCALYLRDVLALSQQVAGPAIILQEDATTYIPPGWTGTVDRDGNLLLVSDFDGT